MIKKFVLIAFGLAAIIVVYIYCSFNTMILKEKDFSKGDWLLVNSNCTNHTLYIIDDEKTLSNNTNGIRINFSESDLYTTCDGYLTLYKDGKLVEEQQYLDETWIIESSNIRKAYKKAEKKSFDPIDNESLKMEWNRLKLLANYYPTIYHKQPEDKDIIEFYEFTNPK